MNYEEKYKDALERAKNLIALYPQDAPGYREVFPELAESEDERIRKWLLDFAIGMIAGLESDISRSTYDGIKGHDPESEAELAQWQKARAYLEKQKETLHITETCKENADSFTDEDERIRRTLVEYFGPKVQLDFVRGVPIQKIRDWLEKQKEQKPWKVGANAYFTPEQKPAESISQLTVQGKGVYKICPRCKERMVRDDSMVYTSMPPQYRYECPKCGESECDTVMYDNPEMEEQKPVDLSDMMVHKEPYIAPVPTPMVADEQKPEWSEEDENCIRNLESVIYYDKNLPTDTRIKLGDFLKSLRSQSHWKPSEHQMTILKNVKDYVGKGSGYWGEGLGSLIDDLEKLM